MTWSKEFKISSLMAIVLIYSLFLTNYYARNKIIGSAANINFLFYISFIIMIASMSNIKVSKLELLIILLIILQAVIINYINYVSLKKILYSIVMYFLPLFVLVLKLKPGCVDSKNKLRLMIKAINFFIFLMGIIYIIDCFSNCMVMKFISRNIAPYIANWLPTKAALFSYRYASFMGHYLITAECYMIFYLINMCYNKSHKNSILKPMIINIITIVGVLSTGSKTAIILLIISLLWFNLRGKNKIRNFIGLTLLIIGAYYLGIFDLVFSRFNNELLSTGRNEVWNSILSSNTLKIHFFYGYGEAIDSILTNIVGTKYAAIAKEYSFIILILKFGVINIIGMLYFLVLKPCYIAFKNGKTYIAFSILIVFIEINTFNAYLLICDDTLLFVIFVMMLNMMDNDIPIETKVLNNV